MSYDPHAVDPLADQAGAPVDLAAVARDEELLNQLHRGAFTSLLRDAGADFSATMRRTDLELTLAQVLVAWREDRAAEPAGDLVDTDAAMEAVEAGTRRPPQAVSPLFQGVLIALAVSIPALALLIWLVSR